MKNICVLDLGSNTFEYLLATMQPDFKKPQSLASGEIFVNLSADALSNGDISPDGIIRASNAISDILAFSSPYAISDFVGVATSVFRSAPNGPEVIHRLNQKFGTRIKLISGTDESQYIQKAVVGYFGTHLTFSHLDIGGGSVEFTHNSPKKSYSFSLDIGAQRLLNQFPINPEIAPSSDYLNSISNYLKPYEEQIKEHLPHPIEFIAGTSGTFDTLFEIANNYGIQDSLSYSDFQQILFIILESNYEQRKGIKGLIPERLNRIVPALCLVNWYYNLLGTHLKLLHCPYALKEGFLLSLHPSEF